jgi:hypothetical protein
MTTATLESPTPLERKSRADADSPWKLAFDLYFDLKNLKYIIIIPSNILRRRK